MKVIVSPPAAHVFWAGNVAATGSRGLLKIPAASWAPARACFSSGAVISVFSKHDDAFPESKSTASSFSPADHEQAAGGALSSCLTTPCRTRGRITSAASSTASSSSSSGLERRRSFLQRRRQKPRSRNLGFMELMEQQSKCSEVGVHRGDAGPPEVDAWSPNFGALLRKTPERPEFDTSTRSGLLRAMEDALLRKKRDLPLWQHYATCAQQLLATELEIQRPRRLDTAKSWLEFSFQLRLLSAFSRARVAHSRAPQEPGVYLLGAKVLRVYALLGAKVLRAVRQIRAIRQTQVINVRSQPDELQQMQRQLLRLYAFVGRCFARLNMPQHDLLCDWIPEALGPGRDNRSPMSACEVVQLLELYAWYVVAGSGARNLKPGRSSKPAAAHCARDAAPRGVEAAVLYLVRALLRCPLVNRDKRLMMVGAVDVETTTIIGDMQREIVATEDGGGQLESAHSSCWASSSRHSRAARLPSCATTENEQDRDRNRSADGRSPDTARARAAHRADISSLRAPAPIPVHHGNSSTMYREDRLLNPEQVARALVALQCLRRKLKTIAPGAVVALQLRLWASLPPRFADLSPQWKFRIAKLLPQLTKTVDTTTNVYFSDNSQRKTSARRFLRVVVNALGKNCAPGKNDDVEQVVAASSRAIDTLSALSQTGLLCRSIAWAYVRARVRLHVADQHLDGLTGGEADNFRFGLDCRSARVLLETLVRLRISDRGLLETLQLLAEPAAERGKTTRALVRPRGESAEDPLGMMVAAPGLRHRHETDDAIGSLEQAPGGAAAASATGRVADAKLERPP